MPFGLRDCLPTYPLCRPWYQVSVRQATISLSLLLACISRYKPWESLSGSSATTPLMDFHHRLMTCPSYKQEKRESSCFSCFLLMFMAGAAHRAASALASARGFPLFLIIHQVNNYGSNNYRKHQRYNDCRYVFCNPSKHYRVSSFLK